MAKNTDKIIAYKKTRHEIEKSYLHMIARVYVLVILAIFPLCVGFEGYDDIIHSKAMVFWFVAVDFFISFGLFYLVYWFGLDKSERPPGFWKSFSIPDWAVFAFFIIVTISFLFSSYKDMAFLGQTNRSDGWLTYFYIIMSCFVLSRWYRLKLSDFAIFSINSILVCIIGFMQLRGNDFMKLFPRHVSAYIDSNGNPLFSGYFIHFCSTLGDIDFVSAYACVSIVVCGILYVKTKGPLRFLYLAVAGMNFDLMIIGGADVGKVGVLGAIILLIPYWLSERKGLGRILTLAASWGFIYVIHHWIILAIVRQRQVEFMHSRVYYEK